MPPVASTSSSSNTRRPRSSTPLPGISSAAESYSRLYSRLITGGGSLPPFRTASTPVPSVAATPAPSRNPRASTPATRSASGAQAASDSITERKPSASAKTGVRSAKRTPGVGKSSCQRVRRSTCRAASAVRSATCSSDSTAACLLIDTSP
ncbi:Uncharacterised protein [Mycobacteroides abscessus subsp. abscessus]|nr:Uncharacterised protein [Mycobacteroides abscessus subsp. abscessus]